MSPAILISALVFVLVAAGIFVAFTILDKRSERARLLRDRLAAVQKAAERAPSEELALLRDEMLSEIPALDNLLRRSERVSNLQILLSQADMDIRAGNMLLLCAGSGIVFAVIAYSMGGAIIFGWVGLLLGTFLPYSYASYRRSKRFQKFEELF